MKRSWSPGTAQEGKAIAGDLSASGRWTTAALSDGMPVASSKQVSRSVSVAWPADRSEPEGGSGAPVHYEHGTPAVRRDRARHAADENAGETTLAVGAEHDQARVAVIGDPGDPLPCWRFLDRETLGAEAGGLRHRGSLRSGLLGSFSDLLARRRVELDLGRRDEPNRVWTPYGQHDGVPSRLKLAARLLDREPGQVRAVVGEQHRPKVVGAHVTAPVGWSATGVAESPSRGPPYCPPASQASGSVRTVAPEESRMRSSSGGEHQA